MQQARMDFESHKIEDKQKVSMLECECCNRRISDLKIGSQFHIMSLTRKKILFCDSCIKHIVVILNLIFSGEADKL